MQDASESPSIASSTSTTSTPTASGTLSDSSSSMTFASSSPPLSPLLRSPAEIIHRVLIASGSDSPVALAKVSQTCRELRSFVYENTDLTLWKGIHLARWDDPHEACAFPTLRADIDWKKRAQDRELVARIAEWDAERFPELEPHLDRIVTTLLDLYLDLPARPDEDGIDEEADKEARNIAPLVDFLRSPAFEYIILKLSLKETLPSLRPLRGQAANPNRRPQRNMHSSALSRLHLLLPPSIDESDDAQRQYRGAMREIVYTAANFREENDYAPLDRDGKVDWKLLDAIGTIMMCNGKEMMTEGEDSWRRALAPLSYGLEPMRGLAWRGIARPPELDKDAVWDWAGVEGQWCGSYAFIDYSDWVTLNIPRMLIYRPNRPPLELADYSEAIGDLMLLNLTVVKHLPPEMPEIKTALPTSDLLPPIYFQGASASSQLPFVASTPASFVRGVVQLTADDPPQIRWTLVINYGSADRWRLECVQPGGRGSARGFFGCWTDAQREAQSPNGPVWYWKA